MSTASISDRSTTSSIEQNHCQARAIANFIHIYYNLINWVRNLNWIGLQPHSSGSQLAITDPIINALQTH